jgi:hypothetical protein
LSEKAFARAFAVLCTFWSTLTLISMGGCALGIGGGGGAVGQGVTVTVVIVVVVTGAGVVGINHVVATK